MTIMAANQDSRRRTTIMEKTRDRILENREHERTEKMSGRTPVFCVYGLQT